MLQSQFDQIVSGIGGVYVQSAETQRYELVSLAVIFGNVNNRIQVFVLDENGAPLLGAHVRHSFGDDFEEFQFMGSPAQFNLGSGSHYSVPSDPPDHITISDGESDEVRVGNSNLIGFSHTEWSMTFQLRKTSPPPGEYVTRTEAQSMIDASLNAAFERAKP